MRKTIHYTVIIFLSGLAFGACRKQLNVLPTTQEVDGNIITDQKSASTALNGVYYQFACGGTDYNSVPSTLWYRTNEEFPGQLSGMLTYTEGGGGFNEHTYNAKSSGIDVVWNNAYAIVNAANGFLKNIAPVTTIESSAKTQMIAETKFLRAYANSQLLLYYGQYNDTTSPLGIILRTEFVSQDNIYLSRVSVATTYDSILADLDNAIPSLPSLNTANYYANTWAAKLLEARVLINRGGAADYARVISLTQDIIANGPFSLDANVQNIFWTEGLASNEVILGVDPYSSQNIKWTSYIYDDDYGPSTLMQQLFNGDPRAAWCIQTVINPYGAHPAVTKYYPGSVNDILFTPVTENGYAFRLTEAYLLQAEAIVASNGSLAAAKTLLTTVLTNAGVTDFTAVNSANTPAALQLQIIEEEMRNFVSEAGQDWFALRRLPFTTIQGLAPTIIMPSLLILPIPYSETSENANAQQNPDY
jgi:starch-binding outer membrane protein, SusD/RagB family